MRIYIPTLGRLANQQTLAALPVAVTKKYKATLVCPPSEAKTLKAAGHLVLACPKQGIAATRQFILDNADDDLVLMLDDDLNNWSIRRGVEKGCSYTKGTDAEITQHFAAFDKAMKGRVHGAIGFRLFAQEKDPIYFNTRMLRALCYRPNLLKLHKVKFRLPVMEDFDVTLQLLKKGEEAMIYNWMVQDQRATNQPGGCSLYRTLEVQTAAAHLLAKTHPDCVQAVVNTVNKDSPSWKGIGSERVDVRVNWRAAAKLGGL